MSNKIINLINQTHLTITKQNVVSPTQFILITISGGQDSLCLFFILLHLKRQWKWRFGLLYCNHFWQIDSFYINSLICKLGFFFLLPAYLSLPSGNIFSEQKSRTWRYGQFGRLSNFYKYDIIFTGHTSTDKIETVLLQLLRGTGTRGLSTLEWSRPISRNKSTIPPFPSKRLPQVFFPPDARTQMDKPGTIFKNDNVSFSHNSFQIQFCNQFFLSWQINCLQSNFFYKTTNIQLILYERFKQYLFKVLAQSKNLVLLENQIFLNDKQSWSQRLSLNSHLQFELSFGGHLEQNTVTLQRVIKRGFITLPLRGEDGQNIFCRNTSWIYDTCLLLTLEKTPIFTSLEKLRSFSFKKKLFFPFLNSTRYPIFNNSNCLLGLKSLNRLSSTKVDNPGNVSTTHLNWLSSYYHNRNLIDLSLRQRQKLFQLKSNFTSLTLLAFFISLVQTNSINFSANFTRRTPFSINRRIIFRNHLGMRQASSIVDKILFFFSLTSSHRLEYSINRKFENNIVSRKDKPFSFIFNNIGLNKKPSKILIKYLKLSYWVKFKKNFAELEVSKLKKVLNLEITPFLIKSYFFLPHYQQVAIILTIYPLIAFSFWGQAFFAQTMFEDLIFSEQDNSKDKKDLKYIEQLNSDLNFLSFDKHKANKNLVLFINTNQKLKAIFFSAEYTLIKQRQRHNWGKSYFFCQESIKKENSFTETKNKVKLSKTANLVARLKSKIIVNCQHFYVKKKIKNFLYKNFLLLNSPIYQIKDHTIFLSLHTRSDLSSKINKDVPSVLPNQEGFNWYEKNTKQSFVVRPLLFITRFDLKKVCAFWHLPVYPDQTNEKLVYFRNRVRKQLLPLLRFFFNPQIDKLFLQFAEIANTEQLYLDGLTTHLQEEFQIKKTNTFELNLSVFHFLPIAIQRRLLKQFLDQYFTKQIKFFHIQILIAVLAKRKKSHSKFDEKLRYKNNFLIRENCKTEYQMFSEVLFRESLSIIFTADEKFLDNPKVINLTNKLRSEFLQHFIFVKQKNNTKAKLRRNLVNCDKKLKVRNVFSEKNKLETPQILLFAGVGACFINSHRFILLSNFLIV
uniref:tRNA(Ile)-lysidine synthase, chloroplastic n=1 Tax=Koliella longiseta TaxID=33092 RepID=A0A097KLI1_9CHLO|nr:hypothetical chloroplast RF62 [Koliella longiseta]AIT94037.1 hypothetical chloroplast RF62 [Koliella longiseta]